MLFNINDTLKLRYYEEDEDTMLYDVEIFHTFLLQCASHHNDISTTPFPLMRCSGIKDSDDKLIYEKDIIEIRYNENRKENYIVKFGEFEVAGYTAKFIGFYIQSLEDNAIWSLHHNASQIKILGNIYESEEYKYLKDE